MVSVLEVTAALGLQCECAAEARGGSPHNPYKRVARKRAVPWGRSTSVYGRAAVPRLDVPGVSRPTRRMWCRLPGPALSLWSRCVSSRCVRRQGRGYVRWEHRQGSR